MGGVLGPPQEVGEEEKLQEWHFQWSIINRSIKRFETTKDEATDLPFIEPVVRKELSLANF